MRVPLFIVLAALMTVVACGKSSTPAAPTPVATVTGVTISTATDMLRVGQSETFSASASHSDGSISSQITWSTSDSTVASVDMAGKVSPLKNGNVDIIATHDTATARKPVRVVPNFQGTWSGRYSITNCTNTGDYATIGFCNIMSGGGPIQLVLTQNRDSVSGTVYFGSLNTAVTGPIDSSGYMAVSASQIPGSFAITFSNWGLAITSDDRMVGVFTEDWRYTNAYMSGVGRIDCQFTTVTRTAAMRPVWSSGTPRTLNEYRAALGIR